VHKTEDFYEFYKDKMLAPDAKPNAAHYKLAELEKAGKLKAVITQNIDGLHQAAGSKEVLELHGSVLRNYCTKCGKEYSSTEEDVHAGVKYILASEGVPKCDNVVDGKVFDLTSEQFGDEELDYTDNPEQSREEHFAKTEKKERYEYLKAQLHKYIESEGEDYGRECIL